MRMNTYISTSEYMFQASVMFNKKLRECSDQEREQIKTKVLSRRAEKRELVTEDMIKRYGRDWNY